MCANLATWADFGVKVDVPLAGQQIFRLLCAAKPDRQILVLFLARAKFLALDQWNQDIVTSRGNRPTLVVDQLGQYVDQVVNDWRRNRLGIMTEVGVTMSRPGAYDEVFRRSVIALADDEPIDNQVAHPKAPLPVHVSTPRATQ